MTLHKVLSRYLSAAVVEVRSNDTVFRFSLSSSPEVEIKEGGSRFFGISCISPEDLLHF